MIKSKESQDKWNLSEMAAVGEQQQDEDAAELTFPKVICNLIFDR